LAGARGSRSPRGRPPRSRPCRPSADFRPYEQRATMPGP
jgi:hypothetical protein